MPDLGKGDIQGWLVIADPGKIYNAKQLQGYDRIQFTYMQDNFSESKSANYSSTAILGRSEPVRGYLGSTARAINLQLMIPPDGDGSPVQSLAITDSNISFPGGETGQSVTNATFTLDPPVVAEDFTRKLQVIDFIRSLVYPNYGQQSQQMVYPPPRVLVLLGSWFSMLGIVTTYNMVHKAPWKNTDMTPYYTDVSITVEECDEPYSFKDVYTGALRQSGKQHSGFNSGLSSRIG